MNNPEYLHIHCGDASASVLRKIDVSGDIAVWREIYTEGPVPGHVEKSEFIKIRAGFISSITGLDRAILIEGMKRNYTMIETAGRYREVILWFDSCMFDQVIMIHLITLCAAQRWENTKLSLICEDCALGAMELGEMAALMEVRHEVSNEEIVLANTAWKAFTSDDPRDIEQLIAMDNTALPFLADAMKRHLEQFPSPISGLNRTQQQLLQISERGTDRPTQIFKQLSQMESRPFLGDTSLWNCIDELAVCRQPLFSVNGPGRIKLVATGAADFPQGADEWRVEINELGRDVLNGKADFIDCNGIDRWHGGVHLTGKNSSPWRWDADARKLIAYG